MIPHGLFSLLFVFFWGRSLVGRPLDDPKIERRSRVFTGVDGGRSQGARAENPPLQRAHRGGRWARALQKKERSESGARSYPALQLSYLYGKSFGVQKGQKEHSFGLYAWPWQHQWRLGFGIELGVLEVDTGGHLGLSLSLGYQGAAPLLWYVDLVALGGVHHVTLYLADVLAPLVKAGLHLGVGVALWRLHGTVGVVLEQTELFHSNRRRSGFSVGMELRMGL